MRVPRALTLVEVQSAFQDIGRTLDKLTTDKRVDWERRRITNASDAQSPGDYVTLRQLQVAMADVTRAAGANIPLAYFGSPAGIGTQLLEGTSLLSARADHIHNFTIQTKDLSLVGAYTSFMEVSIATTEMCGGVILYMVKSTDTTDHQVEAGTLSYGALNKAGTYTTGVSKGAWVEPASAGTIEVLFQTTTGTNKVILQAKANTPGFNPTTLQLRYIAIEFSGQTVTIL